MMFNDLTCQIGATTTAVFLTYQGVCDAPKAINYLLKIPHQQSLYQNVYQIVKTFQSSTWNSARGAERQLRSTNIEGLMVYAQAAGYTISVVCCLSSVLIAINYIYASHVLKKLPRQTVEITPNQPAQHRSLDELSQIINRRVGSIFLVFAVFCVGNVLQRSWRDSSEMGMAGTEIAVGAGIVLISHFFYFKLYRLPEELAALQNRARTPNLSKKDS